MDARPSRARAGWAVAVAALVVFAAEPLDRDGGRAARPTFTLFVVDREGARQPVALFDGFQWASPCTAAGRPATSQALPPVMAIEGSPGAPLYPVRLLAGDPGRWREARRAVEAVAGGPRDLEGRILEVAVYGPTGTPSSAVFVDLVVRAPAPAWWGVVASAWVDAAPGQPPRVVSPRVASFDSYDEFLTMPRLHPLGVADVGVSGQRTWVMQARAGEQEEIRLVDLGRGSAEDGPRVVRGGC